MPRREKKRPRSPGRYHPTPIPDLVLCPTVLLLNIVVTTHEDDAKTDGPIPIETVNKVSALVRHAYDLSDLDLEHGKGVAISFINQFFHPDDYLDHHIARDHAQGLLDALQGDLQPRTLEAPEARPSKMPDAQALALEGEKAMTLYYKQRFLSICFAGSQAELDKLQGDAPDELLDRILSILWQDLDLSDKLFVLYYPVFVPAPSLRKVSQQNALQWTREVSRWMKEGKFGSYTVVGPPGPSYTVRPGKPPHAEKGR